MVKGLFKTNKESYIEYLKKSNEDFEISNDYLEGGKEYEQMDSMEKADIDFINRMFGGL